MKRMIPFALVTTLCTASLPLSSAAAAAAEESMKPASHGGEGGHAAAKVNWFDFKGKTPPLIASFVNLALMLFILWYFGRKPIGRYFAQRAQRIKAALEESRELKRQSDEKYKAILEKLERIEEDIQQMKKDVLAAAVADNETAAAAAHAQAEEIRGGTLKLVEREKEALADSLRRELAGKVVDRAQEILRETVRAQDHRSIVKETIEALTGKMHA